MQILRFRPVALEIMPESSAKFEAIRLSSEQLFDWGLEQHEKIFLNLVSERVFLEYWKYSFGSAFDGKPDQRGFFSRNTDYNIHHINVACDQEALGAVASAWPSILVANAELELRVGLGSEEGDGNIAVQRRFLTKPTIAWLTSKGGE